MSTLFLIIVVFGIAFALSCSLDWFINSLEEKEEKKYVFDAALYKQLQIVRDTLPTIRAEWVHEMYKLLELVVDRIGDTPEKED